MLAVTEESLDAPAVTPPGGGRRENGSSGQAPVPGTEERRCQYPQCATRLSAYNPDRLCWVHGRSVAFDRLDRVFAPRQTPTIYKPDWNARLTGSEA